MCTCMRASVAWVVAGRKGIVNPSSSQIYSTYSTVISRFFVLLLEWMGYGVCKASLIAPLFISTKVEEGEVFSFFSFEEVGPVKTTPYGGPSLATARQRPVQYTTRIPSGAPSTAPFHAERALCWGLVRGQGEYTCYPKRPKYRYAGSRTISVFVAALYSTEGGWIRRWWKSRIW